MNIRGIHGDILKDIIPKSYALTRRLNFLILLSSRILLENSVLATVSKPGTKSNEHDEHLELDSSHLGEEHTQTEGF